MARQPDPIFSDPRLAAIYDDVDGSRDDLDHYVDIIGEVGAERVLDIGCGTGALACRLALAGIDVIGVDPADASLAVARSKLGSESVTWVHGDATSLPPDLSPVDVAIMTGNVAQVFTTDEDWNATLSAATGVLRSGGHLVFETRVPAKRAWESWDSHGEITTVATIKGDVETWMSVLEATGSLVTFRQHYRFVGVDEIIMSDSTLRFRTLDELSRSLTDAGFTIDEVRDAPDRPGREFVVLARLSTT